jgi:hypothetical protein
MLSKQICSDSTVDPDGVAIGKSKCTDPNMPLIAAAAIAVLGVCLLLGIGFVHQRSESAREKEYVLEDVEMQKVRSERKKSSKAKKKAKKKRQSDYRGGSESSGSSDSGSGSSSGSGSDSDDGLPAVPPTLTTEVSEGAPAEGTPPELPTVPAEIAISHAGGHRHRHQHHHEHP